MVLACTGLEFLLVGITGNMRMATSVAGVIGACFCFCWANVPIIAMPFFVRCFAFLLPLTHLLKIQSQMILGDVGLIPSWIHLSFCSAWVCFGIY
jgi:ABC-2 type transport system permease protein